MKILLILFGALLILAKPEWFLKPKLMDSAENLIIKKLKENGVDVHWKQFRLNVHSKTLFKKEIHVSALNPCVLDKDSLRFCAEKLDVTLVMNLAIPPHLSEIGPVTISKGELETYPSKSESNGSPVVFPEIPQEILFHPLHIDLDKVSIATTDEIYRGQIHFESQDGQNEMKFQAIVQAFLERAKRSGKIELAGALQQKSLRARVTAKSDGISLENCEFQFRQDALDQIQTHCPVAFEVPEFSNRSSIELPKNMKAMTDFEISGRLLPWNPQIPLDAKASIEILPFSMGVADGKVQIKSEYHGKVPQDLSKILQSDSLRTDANVDLQISKFENLVRKLRGTKWEIPAPFDVLHGKIGFSSKGELFQMKGLFPWSFTTDLHSKTQTLGLIANGELKFNLNDFKKNIDLTSKLELTNVQLELPRLDLEVPPRVASDPRITPISKQEAGKSPPPFTYQADVETETQPIRLLSNRAKAPIPIRMKLNISDVSSPQGTIHVESFPLELFRRNANVDHFDLKLKDPVGESEINGLMNLKYSDYTIKILLTSSVDKPVVTLQSDPPVPEDQLYAYLLFGRPLDELDPEQINSSGNAKAAAADGAVGLVSLYALASTPVESVGYDPSTGIFTAKVRLREGTSLNLGSDSGGVSQIGIRQRLGGNFSIETNLNQPSSAGSTNPLQGQDQNVSTLLMWSKRY